MEVRHAYAQRAWWCMVNEGKVCCWFWFELIILKVCMLVIGGNDLPDGLKQVQFSLDAGCVADVEYAFQSGSEIIVCPEIGQKHGCGYGKGVEL